MSAGAQPMARVLHHDLRLGEERVHLAVKVDGNRNTTILC